MWGIVRGSVEVDRYFSTISESNYKIVVHTDSMFSSHHHSVCSTPEETKPFAHITSLNHEYMKIYGRSYRQFFRFLFV